VAAPGRSAPPPGPFEVLGYPLLGGRLSPFLPFCGLSLVGLFGSRFSWLFSGVPCPRGSSLFVSAGPVVGPSPNGVVALFFPLGVVLCYIFSI
jgi:hypothetical protein